MSAGFIGGRLEDISSAAEKLTATGINAEGCGEQTKQASEDLQTAINEAMQNLTTRFNGIATDLNGEIKAAHDQLGAADWQGQSFENALQIKTDLQTQVNNVVDQATTAIDTERGAFEARATEIVTEVGQKFHTLMGEVNTKYGDLAKASNQTMINLQEADKTIAMG